MLSWLLVGFAQASEARIEFRVVDQDEMGVPLARIRVVCGGVPLSPRPGRAVGPLIPSVET